MGRPSSRPGLGGVLRSLTVFARPGPEAVKVVVTIAGSDSSGGLKLEEGTSQAVSPLPVLAMGGTDEANAGAVTASGAAGVAVRGAILQAADPRETALPIRKTLSTKGNPG
uniref:Uncharacterized protein n=1 Tax=uncultured marine microorganism HF4000_APKG8C21 TaxID=455553 RepID=B3TA32_9ZZZZ|nr:hypothetical protein ALOHA_HF4000APKG8C21ctg1g29 [uncultured marine microorganism HF4000_APKG8C21]